MLSAFGPFVTDFYLPALPVLTGYFGTTTSMVQLSLTFGMIGLAAGQLLIGPLSDRYGRRVLLFYSLVGFALATAGAIFTTHITVFLALRLLQGIFGSGSIVVSKSIATDLYEGGELGKFISVMSIVQGLAPIFAPVLGGLLLQVMNWQGVFGVLLLVSLILLAMLASFKESLPAAFRVKEGSLWRVFITYGDVLRNRKFMFYVYVQAFAMGAMFTYISASPFIFREHYGVSSLGYSFIFGVNGFAIMLGSLSSLRFQGLRRPMGLGSLGFWVLSLAVALLLVGGASYLAVEVAFFVQMFCLGMILPTSMALALGKERARSGRASAVLGFLTFLAGGIVSPLTGLGQMVVSTAVLISVCSTATLLLAWIACGRRVPAVVGARK